VPASRQHALAEHQVVAFRSLSKLTEGDDFRVIFTDAGPAMVVDSDRYVAQEDWRAGELLAGHGFVEDQPEQAEGADRFGEVAEFHRFADVRVGAQAVAGEDVFLLFRTGEDHDRDELGPLVAAGPAHHLQAIHFGELQIEQDEAVCVRVLAVAGEKEI